ncbi:hypothetical protein BH10PSE3_BH10PSE3_22250 [soil metagenome]
MSLAVRSALCAALLLLGSAAQAAVTPVPVGQPLARFANLKPGVHRYLRFKQAGDTIRVADVWTREIRFEDLDGQRRMHIVQHWDGVGAAPSDRALDSWFEIGTFRPLTHIRRSTKDGVTKVEGFEFKPDRIVGLKDLADNTVKDFEVASPEPSFNFETDMEFLQALPLAAGYEASIVFTHPGGGPPAAYLFKVAGSEALDLPGGGKIDCWVVTADYNHPEMPITRFWFAKGSQVMIKQISTLPNGAGAIGKTLLY